MISLSIDGNPVLVEEETTIIRESLSLMLHLIRGFQWWINIQLFPDLYRSPDARPSHADINQVNS